LSTRIGKNRDIGYAIRSLVTPYISSQSLLTQRLDSQYSKSLVNSKNGSLDKYFVLCDTQNINSEKEYRMKEKICPRCSIKKTEREFYHSGPALSVLSWYCKDCTKKCAIEYKKAHYIPHPRKYNSPMDHIMVEMWNNLIKRSLVRRGEIVEIEREEFINKVKDFCSGNYHSFERHHPFRPSVDRINSKLGYTNGNTRIIWLIENYAKNNFDDATVLEFCKRKLGLL